jgi:hypothetical protein
MGPKLTGLNVAERKHVITVDSGTSENSAALLARFWSEAATEAAVVRAPALAAHVPASASTVKGVQFAED